MTLSLESKPRTIKFENFRFLTKTPDIYILRHRWPFQFVFRLNMKRGKDLSQRFRVNWESLNTTCPGWDNHTQTKKEGNCLSFFYQVILDDGSEKSFRVNLKVKQEPQNERRSKSGPTHGPTRVGRGRGTRTTEGLELISNPETVPWGRTTPWPSKVFSGVETRVKK